MLVESPVVQKGRFLALIDQNLSPPRQETLDALESGRSLLEIGQDTGILDEGDRRHVEGEVLGDDELAWFRDFSAKEDIVRAGYAEAIRKALAAKDGPLPIVSYWVGGPKTFEMNVLATPREIIVLMTTPSPPPFPSAPASAATEDGITVVAAESRIDEIAGSYDASWGVSKEDTSVSAVKKVDVKGR